MTQTDWASQSSYARTRAHLEAGTRKALDETDAIPTTYAGTGFRSRLEAAWASTLDNYDIKWEYEPELAVLGSGTHYLPDFRLPELATVIEVKGPHMHRLDKTREYAKEVHPGTIVLIGYPAARRSLSPYLWESFMQWGDALGHMAAFTICTECGAHQWCRPRFSMSCRRCGKRFGGHFAACGEMRFTEWQDDPYEPPFPFREGSAG